MDKSKIAKAIESGSVKERALILSNHVANISVGEQGFLTQMESQAILNSFRSEKELKHYRRYRNIFDQVKAFLPILSQTRFSYMLAIEKLDTRVQLRQSANVVASLLDLMPDKKTKDKAIKIAGGLINSALKKELAAIHGAEMLHDSDEFIHSSQKIVKEEQINLKTCILAIKDYIHDTGFKVKVFSGFVKEVEMWAKSKEGKDSTFRLTTEILDQSVSPTIRLLAKEHFLELDYDKIPVNQELYKKYREVHLNA